MSLQTLRKELKGLRESVKDRPLDILLKCKGDDLTDAELETVFREIPLRQISSDIILSYLNRAYGTSYKLIDDLPDGLPIEWTEPE